MLLCQFGANLQRKSRGRSRTVAASKMEHYVIIVKGLQTLTIITMRSILDVAAVLDLPLKNPYRSATSTKLQSNFFKSHFGIGVHL